MSETAITQETVKAELDELLSSLEQVANYTDPQKKSEQSHRLLGGLFKVVGKLNYLLHEPEAVTSQHQAVSPAITSSGVMESLDEWVLKIRQALAQLAKFLAAASYTIGFSIPFGLQVSITFTP